MTADGCVAYREDDVIGEVTEDADRALALHLADCPSCRERAAEFHALQRSASACRGGSVIRWRAFETPFGRMRIAASRDGLVELSWRSASDEAFIEGLERRFERTPVVCDCDHLGRAEQQLREYFERKRRRFDLPVDLGGLTRFQRTVLAAAAAIDFGRVATYSDIAARIGNPRASRAVGNALGRNPVAIVVPCHRVLRSDGSLGGYTGGLGFKEALLEIEGRADLFAAR